MEFGSISLTEYEVSLVSGALIIALFAYDRLNRPSYEAAVKQARLLKLLNPADLQRRSAFLKAYIVYTVLLLAIYALLCLGGTSLLAILVAEPAGLPSPIAHGPAGGDAPLDDPLAGDPRVPLYVALLLVGIFPALPQLQAVENVFRRLAHTLAGIPHRFFAVTHAVATTPLTFDDLERSELSALKKQEIGVFVDRARNVFGAGAQTDQFAQRLIKLHLLQAWLADGKNWSRPLHLESFAEIEGELMPSFFALEEDLRDLAERESWQPTVGLAEAPHASDLAPAPLVTAETRWRKTFDLVRNVHDDFCMLFALYLTRTSMEANLSAQAVQLRGFLRQARINARRKLEGFDLLLGYLVVLGSAMFVAGYVLALAGLYRAPGSDPVAVAGAFLVSTLQIYLPAGLAAILFREGARAGGGWFLWWELDRPPATQLVEVFVFGYVASAATLAVLNFLAIADGDLYVDWSRFRETGLLAEQLYFGLLGAVHAVFFVLELDARGEPRVADRARYLPVAHGAALAVVCFFILEYLYGEVFSVTEIGVSAGLAAMFGLISGAFSLGRLWAPARAGEASAVG